MIPLEPEERAAHEEAAHLVAAVVEDEAVPVGVKALAPVAVLVEVRAVEVADRVLVGREVRWDPIEDHAEAALVQMIHQEHEVLRRPVSARRREVARGLVAPRSVEGVLHDRQQLDVGEPRRGGVVGEQGRDFAITERAVVLVGHASPRAQVHLVDRLRCIERVSPALRRHPLAVAPFVVERPHDRRRVRRHLAVERDRIGLVDLVATVPRTEVVLVARPVAQLGDEPFPDAGRRAGAKRVAGGLPAVEVADHRNHRGVRRPYGEDRPVHSVDDGRMCAELVGEAEMRALVEEVEVLVGEQRRPVPPGVGRPNGVCGDSHGRCLVRAHPQRLAASVRRMPASGIRTHCGRLLSS